MLRTRSNSLGTFRVSSILIVALALLVGTTGTAFGDKKKKAGAAEDPLQKRIAIDTSNLVWPQPPELPRIRWVQQFTGEKIDWAKFDGKQKKQKQSWMDRRAGTQSAAQQNIKLPFQLIRACGLTVDSKGTIYAADQGVD